MEAEEGEGGDEGPQQDSGVKDHQHDEERLLIMAPFAKAFNFTFDDLGVDEASGVQLDPAMEEEEVLLRSLGFVDLKISPRSIDLTHKNNLLH